MANQYFQLGMCILAVLIIGSLWIITLLYRMLERIEDIGGDVDLVRSAAEGIERNVIAIAAPITTAKGKRFMKRLRTAWPTIVRQLTEHFSKR